MNLRAFGFFRELEHGDPQGGSIHDLMRAEPGADEEQLARYLVSGVPIFGGSGVFHDVVSGSSRVIGAYQLLTDGTWIWPSDLAYYLRTYHLALPEQLVDHVRANGFVVPRISGQKLGEISRAWVLDQSARKP